MIPSYMNPPLTESGQFDESSSASVENIVFSNVRNCRHLAEGGESNRGVVIGEYGGKKIVFKASQEPAREMFLTRLCRHLGVSAPAIRFVLQGTQDYKELGRVVRAEKPVMLVMEFVHGQTLGRISPASAKKFFCLESPETASTVLRAVGRIMALDVFTNNWDRIPLIHDNAGNFGNVILQEIAEDGSAILVAIDNAMTGIRREYGTRRNQMYDVYLQKVENLLKQLVDCGKKTECDLVQSVRSLIGHRTAAIMKSKEGIAIQTGLAEMFLRIAKFDQLTEEKDIVASMGPKYDSWFEADLERVDLVFLGDVQNLIRKYQERLQKEFGFE